MNNMNGTLLNSIAIIILSIGIVLNAYGHIKQDKQIEYLDCLMKGGQMVHHYYYNMAEIYNYCTR